MISVSNCITSTAKPPVAPSGVTAVSGNGEVIINWDASIGADRYYIYQSLTSGAGYVKINSITNTSYTVNSLINGNTYYYVITAINDTGESKYSEEVQGKPTLIYTYYCPDPAGIAIDASENIWITCGGGDVTELNPNGITIGTYNIFEGPYAVVPKGIAIDSAGNIWVADEPDAIIQLNSSGNVQNIYYGVPTFNSNPYNVLIDSLGDMWVASFAGITKLSSNAITIGTFFTGEPYYNLAIDRYGNVWVAAFSTVTVLTSTGTTINEYTIGEYLNAIAIDNSGDIWLTQLSNSNVSNIVKLSPNGIILGTYPIGKYPAGIGVDIAGNIWVANGGYQGNNTVTELSPDGKILDIYEAGISPLNLAIDVRGDVWITDSLNSTVTELVGVASGPQYWPYKGPQWP